MTVGALYNGRSSRILGKFTALFFILSIFGYPFFASLSVYFGLPNTPVSISYRFAVLILGLTIISFALVNRPVSMTGRGWLLFIFWIIYGSLLINDISFKDIRFRGETPFYLYSFIFGSSFLSFTTMLIGGKYLKVTRKFSWSIVIFLSITMIIIFQSLQFYGTTTSGLFQGRAIISTDLAVGVINPILIGSYGAFLALTSLSLFFIKKRKMQLYKKGLLLCATTIGITGVLFSGSRGPLLLTIIGISLIFLKYITFRKPTSIHVLKVTSIIIGLVLMSSFLFLPFIQDNNITSFKRLTDTVNRNAGGKKELRFYEWESAIRQYINNPILGDKYVTDYDGYYPHNVYLEVLMTTGSIGGILFFTGFILCLIELKRLWQRGFTQAFPIIILSLTVFTMRITSGALHNSVEFWAILGTLCSCSIQYSKKV